MKRILALLIGLLLAGQAFATITLVASSPARGSDTDGTAVVTLGAACAAGDTIPLVITERGAEAATISGISDTVNGSWPAAVVSATDSVGGNFRAWFYVFENTGAGTPAITITTTGAASIEAVALCLHGSTATPDLAVLGTTYNTAGGNETGPATDAVTATAAGMFIAGLASGSFLGSVPTDSGGGTFAPAATADGRSYMGYRAISGAGSEDWVITTGSTRTIIFQATFIEPAAAGSGAAVLHFNKQRANQ